MKSNKREMTLGMTSDDRGRVCELHFDDQPNCSISIRLPENIPDQWALIAKATGDKLFDIIERLKRYSFGITFGLSLDLFRGISLDAEDRGKSVFNRAEESIQNILYSEESLDLISEIASFNNITVDIKSLADQKKDDQLLNIAIVSGINGNYLDQILRGTGKKNVIGEDQLRKMICLLRLGYASLMSIHLHHLKKAVAAKDRNLFAWNDLYEIGILQGEMNLITSFSDPDIIKIHHSTRASKTKSEDQESKRKVRAQEELLLDQHLEKYLKHAEEEWNKKKEIIYHGAMADRLMKKYPELKGDRDILVEKLRPISRKYRFSDFCEGEFKKRTTIISLCQGINNDRYGMRFDSPDNTIEKLNEVIRTPEFYAKWFRKNKTVNLSPEAASLVTETQGYRKKKFSEMTEEEHANTKRLNRLILEHTYPMTPKSLEHGLMRGWKGKKS